MIDHQFGSCCCCGSRRKVRNVVMLSRRAPVPGTGWGCVVCHLPADGAVYVACDRCIEDGPEPREVFDGFVLDGRRVPVAALSPEPFDHDPAGHPEEMEMPPESPRMPQERSPADRTGGGS